MILGIDEAGRGPWAGPLVVGAVVLGENSIDGLTDSKKLTKRRREELELRIMESALGYGLGWASPAEIDELGLASALALAAKRCVKKVNTPFHEIIIDGTVNFLAGTALEGYVTTMKKADLLISSVSAASILAKVARDRYMTKQDVLYPEYGFKDHVGYGTARHIAAIESYGVTPLHRLSFSPLKKYQDSSEYSNSLHDFSLPNDRVNTRAIGDKGEEAAARELERLGHKILERNWKNKLCEIDIISVKHGVYYFTEVKHRRSNEGGNGLSAITSKKLKQMKFAASVYAHSSNLNVDMRLVAISTTGGTPKVEHIINVID